MSTTAQKSVFETLYGIDVSEHVEHIKKLTYLTWAWAWTKVKEAYPTAFYTVYENPQGLNYYSDGRTCWVKTGVTIEGLEHIEYLPVMDNYHKSIPISKVTSFDVNTAIQRSITKACARHGLGLLIYAGEDIEAMREGVDLMAQEDNKPKQHIPLSATKDGSLSDIARWLSGFAPQSTDEQGAINSLISTYDMEKGVLDWIINEAAKLRG